ncbi:MAG: YdeI/OmpD-associated family protein [Bacteroidetes bacterium]|nr:YdeI/OmpD-associated family protein [Bacteroidota bacterium]
MKSFSAKIEIIGINPYVIPPETVLRYLFKKAGRDKGPIQVKGKIQGHDFIQNLVKYAGHWRLYLNTPMRKKGGIDVGDTAQVEIDFDPAERKLEMHPKLKNALTQNKEARAKFESLPPSRQKEIIRYISFLKSEVSVDKNVKRALEFLLGKERFIGRDKP